MKLHSKLHLMMSLLLLFILAFTGVTLLSLEKQFLLREMDKRQSAAMESISNVLREAHVTYDALLLINHLKFIKAVYPESSWLCAVDQEGRVQASLDIAQLGTERSKIQLPKGLRLLARPVMSRGVRLGHVEVGFQGALVEAYVEQSLAHLRTRLVLIGSWALLLGFIAAFLLSHHLSRPIRTLVQAAKEIGEGNLQIELPVGRKDELGLLARAIQDMVAQLKELDQMKQDFVSGTTHELLGPLGAIESHANAVLEELEEATDVPGAYKGDWVSSMLYIKKNAARLKRFITDLLDIAKIERGRMDLALQNVALSAVAAEAVALFGPAAKEKNLALVNKVPRSLPEIRADPERLHQVFANLIGNAIKFTHPGGTIEVVAEQGGPGEVQVRVTDTGIGVPKDSIGRLFNKFEQVKSPGRAAGGSGLGLAICKGIVTAHGGSIGMTSEEGKGTTVRFSLPMAKRTAPLVKEAGIR